MAEIDFIQALSRSTPRNYLERVVEHDKPVCAAVAKGFGEEYWDGDRRYGYGGYRYDGRWRAVAERFASHYGLSSGSRVLDIGCGKAFLLYELTQVVPGIVVTGVDISEYAIAHAKPEVADHVRVADARELPFDAGSFDFVYSLGVFHNFGLADAVRAVTEVERVAKGSHKYIMVESYRNEKEKANLLYWQLTCESFHGPKDWKYLFQLGGYNGDHGFIYFE